MKTLAVSLAFLTFVSAASAHEFWIKPASFTIKPGSRLNVHLLVGDGFPGEIVARNGPKIERFDISTDSFKTPIPGVNGSDPAGSITLDQPGLHIITFRNLPTRIELEADKFNDYLKEEGLDSIIAKRAELGHTNKPGRELFSRCAKSLVQVESPDGTPTVGFDRAVGLRFELIPLTDPANLTFDAAGTTTFKVKALFEGKPLEKITIAARTPDDPSLVIKASTDADGIAPLTLTKRGMWLVSSVHMIPAPASSSPPADWESLWASVTFDARSTSTPQPATPPVTPPAASSSAGSHQLSVEFARFASIFVARLHESLTFHRLAPRHGETKHRLARSAADHELANPVLISTHTFH